MMPRLLKEHDPQMVFARVMIALVVCDGQVFLRDTDIPVCL